MVNRTGVVHPVGLEDNMGNACARAGVALAVWASAGAIAMAQAPGLAPSIEHVQPFSRGVSDLAPFTADDVFARVLDRMWDRSPTFQRQCRRLALGAPELRVRLRLEPATSSTVRARSVVEWRGGALVSAVMYVPHGSGMEELIAHEIEHVLEQVDRVDLVAHVGSSLAWRQGDAFETRRAIDTGRRVASEVAAFRQQARRR
jgi:hypothetical protein